MLQEAKDFTFNGHWKTCKRCSKTRYEGYRTMGEYHWYEGPQFGGGYLGKQTDCVWHDTIVNGKLDLW